MKKEVTKAYCYIFVTLSFLISCGESNQNRGNIVHPREEFLPAGQSVISIPDEMAMINQNQTKAYISRLQRAKKATQLGISRGKPEEMFGEIKGAVSDGLGNLFILDSQNNEVKVFNEEGESLFTFGRGGPGPGEFMSPEDIDIGKDGRIYIADRYNAINIFEPDESGLVYLTSITLHYVPDDFCVLEEKLFVRGIGVNKAKADTTDFKTIHAYSAETGGYLYSFGEPYNSPNTLILKQLSDGLIACNETTNMVITTFDLMPYVYGYTAEGTLSWTAKIENFSQRPVIQGLDNSIQFKSTSDEFNSISFVVPIANSKWFLIQLIERPATRDVRFSDIKIKSYLISSENGSGGYIGSDIPIVLFANQARLFANGLLSSSYPNVMIYDY